MLSLFPGDGVGLVGAGHLVDIKGLLQLLLEFIASTADQQPGLGHLPFKVPLLAFPEHGSISLL